MTDDERIREVFPMVDVMMPGLLAPPTMTVSISARQGIGVGLRILRDSLVAWVRGRTVTFEVRQDR